jgi:hypothetical protein
MRELEVVARSPHCDGERLSVDADLHRFLGGERVRPSPRAVRGEHPDRSPYRYSPHWVPQFCPLCPVRTNVRHFGGVLP